MKIYFADPEYDGQFLRTLDYAPLGAQIGEAWAIAAPDQSGRRGELVQCMVVLCRSLVRSRRQIARSPGIGSAPATPFCAHQIIIVPRTFSCLRCPLIRA